MLPFYSTSRTSCATSLQQQLERGFRAIKMGWRPFGRVSRQLDERLIAAARETVGEEVELMVDAGGSEQFWPHGVTWARETARMLGDYQHHLVRRSPAARRRRRSSRSFAKRRR